MPILCYPREVQNADLHPATISFKFFDRQSMEKSVPVSDIILYMPESASNPNTISWGQEKFGLAGQTVANAAKRFNGAGGVMEGVASALGGGDGIGEIANRLKYSVLANIGSSIANMLGGNATAEGLMGEVAGKIPNPYLTMVFQGVDFRSFAFTFKLTPYSEEDCRIIDRIVKTFRIASLPTREQDAAGALLGYPMECEIEYNWRNARNEWLPRFKRCAITGFDTDYTGNGMFSVMRNGFPTTVTISIKFTELNIVTREEIEGNAGSSSGVQNERGGDIPANLGGGF